MNFCQQSDAQTQLTSALNLSVCVTTRNRPQALAVCLRALWSSQVKPLSVVVSDDSFDREVQQKNHQITKQNPSTTYVLGPQRGVCANRNNALTLLLKSTAEYIAFIDDDICVASDFIAQAISDYEQMSEKRRCHTILSGIHCTDDAENAPTKLSFRGYFCVSKVPETVNLHAAVFPRSLLEIEQWDEQIFFGYEDAELCLRALKNGYCILHCPKLKVSDTCAQTSTLNIVTSTVPVRPLTEYELYIEAARLYVGIKRYQQIFPNRLKLVGFLIVYFVHMVVYLVKRGYLQGLPEIVKRSQIQQLWQQPSKMARG
ncbi:glycosyltransferase family 2 protein [Phormidesmis sp. 146-35]